MTNLATLVRLALAEDVGPGDWSTVWTVDASKQAQASIVAKADVVIAGVEAAVAVFAAIDPALVVKVIRGDASAAAPGDVVLEVSGAAASILTAERTALNFLGRLSGIATLTRSYVDAVRGSSVRVVDTRKTTPGWRQLEKDAVRAGGGTNHRMGLYDMVMIKDNHIAAAGGITAAVNRVRARNQERLPVEVEVRTEDELEEALGLGIERILLDNMDAQALRRAVERTHRLGAQRPELEASGNVTMATIRDVAATGVDLVSVGALTHSAPVADLSLRML
ncbi:MAG: carboxylating nicotinate-nucleotide diphosphorylase [Gemmatimonadetes bacterium]|nr:carboxylating nicotinate-nucleotide diphosphorylase [Gemmatimonadota bacterium]